MLLDYDLFPAIKRGDITLTFRRWMKPQARAGSRHRLDADGVIAISAVDLVPAGEITEQDAERAGYESRALLLEGLARHGGELAASDTVYRIAFTYEREADPRATLANDDALAAADIEAISARLAKMDRMSEHGAWTERTLDLIAQNPGVVSTHLARKAGRERLAFKHDVRKLKALGLTISLDVGYELSPRGRAYLEHVRDSTNVR